jgi:hypothetical protein
MAGAPKRKKGTYNFVTGGSAGKMKAPRQPKRTMKPPRPRRGKKSCGSDAECKRIFGGYDY